MLKDLSQMIYCERKAQQKNIGYVHLGDGSVGVMSNGAGLAMATVDLLSL